jgi:hypothetical protein
MRDIASEVAVWKGYGGGKESGGNSGDDNIMDVVEL